MCVLICRSMQARGVGVLSKCYTTHMDKAMLLLVRRMPDYSNMNVIQLVGESEINVKFLTHPACQTLVKKIWYGHIKTDTHRIMVRQ